MLKRMVWVLLLGFACNAEQAAQNEVVQMPDQGAVNTTGQETPQRAFIKDVTFYNLNGFPRSLKAAAQAMEDGEASTEELAKLLETFNDESESSKTEMEIEYPEAGIAFNQQNKFDFTFWFDSSVGSTASNNLQQELASTLSSVQELEQRVRAALETMLQGQLAVQGSQGATSATSAGEGSPSATGGAQSQEGQFDIRTVISQMKTLQDQVGAFENLMRTVMESQGIKLPEPTPAQPTNVQP